MIVTVNGVRKYQHLKHWFFILTWFLSLGYSGKSQSTKLSVNDSGYFETRGFNVFVFNDRYGLFGDEKASGIEFIHHGVRTATNGDVRLDPTPAQWDSIPQYIKKDVNKASNTIEAFLKYPAFNFEYSIKAEAKENGIVLIVNLSQPLPPALEGRAGFNLEFLPAAYFGKSFMEDTTTGIFPLYPSGQMIVNGNRTDPKPIATGKNFVLAPEDPECRIAIKSESTISLYDGRNIAQNGWFVIRSLIPSNKTGKVVEWFLTPNTISNWIRKPVIAHSQVGYLPSQKKIAVIELDKNDNPLSTVRLLKLTEDGNSTEVIKTAPKEWGTYLRYHYLSFDFSSIKENGLYVIQYGDVQTKPFRIAPDVYADVWHPTLDIYFAEQMDHMYVKEAYRVWHGASHMDDALQAPVNHVHFDLYAQGPTTDSPYKPGEHIPGLNVGGWFDAGDYDIRTQTQYAVVMSLVQSWEMFNPLRDETSINQQTRQVFIHQPDGKQDMLQQIEQGVLQLLAQQKSVGHAINGIIEAHLSQYTHLGDAASKTDGEIYNPSLKEFQTDGFTSGNFDDRWAFTSKSSSLNYGSAAALAAASRVLKNYNDTLANECIATAKKIWEDENSHPPDMFRHGNTTGGPLRDEKLRAALELLITTKEKRFADTINAAIPDFERQFNRYAVLAAEAIPYMDAEYKQKLEPLVKKYKSGIDEMSKRNPFGVPITNGGWAGSGTVIGFAITNYLLHKSFPSIIDAEDVFKGLNFIYGCHPYSDLSFVSAVGTKSKEIAYGNNRADFTFIAGGVVPGVLILPPDFPENKDDWPFLWGENEYVISEAASYIFLVLAANDLLKEIK